MSEFFYRDSDDIVGPISGASLKSLCRRGEISPKTEVRKDDGPWTPAGQVKGLAELFTLETARVVMVSHRSGNSREANDRTSRVNSAKQPTLAPPLSDECVLFEGSPRFLRGLPFFSTKASIAVLLLVTGAAIYQPTISTLVVLAAISVVPILWLLFAFFCIRGMSYEVTTQRIIFVSRLMSRLDFNLRYGDIANVWAQRGLFQRLFGTGDLYLSVNGHQTTRYIPNLANPSILVDEIRKRTTT
ncbi:PH domain-containing protein [bacterium]|nr:PH domain-containing protein [bacterium]